MKARLISAKYDKNEITLWVRTEKGEKWELKVTGFYPYFYIREKEEWLIPKEDPHIISYEKGYKSFRGEPLIKIAVSDPKYVKKIRDIFSEHYEADIPYIRRFLIDSGIKGWVEIPDDVRNGDMVFWKELKPAEAIPNFPLRIAYLDIEVLQEAGIFPDPNKAERPIISISLKTDEVLITLFLGDVDLTEERKWGDTPWVFIQFSDEKRLIEAFNDIIKRTDADILVGWNLIYFDLKYIINRSKNLGVESVFGDNPFEPYYFMSFNLDEGYKKLFQHSSSYRLDYVARVEGFGGKTIDASQIPELYKNKNYYTIAEYNLNDVIITAKIDEKHGITEKFLGLKEFVGVEKMDATVHNSTLVDRVVLEVAKEWGKVLPSAKEKKRDELKGAVVIDPEPGLYDFVAVLDMHRFYPSILWSWNLSPETIDPRGDIKVWGGYKARSDVKGILPEVYERMAKLRDKIDEKIKKATPGTPEYAFLQNQKMEVKTIINSIYGYSAFNKARLYDIRIASAITGTAREILTTMKKWAKELGFEVIYGDTDSVFIKVTENYVEDGEKLEHYINEKIAEYVKTVYGLKKFKLILEFEKVLSPVLIIAKKHYAGRVVYEGGKEADYLLAKGIEYIRSDTSKITKELEEFILKKILWERDVKGAKEYVRELKNKIRRGEYKPSEIAVLKGIGKPLDEYGDAMGKRIPAHVRGSIYANKYLGEMIGEGSKVYMLYVKEIVGYPPTDVICVEKPEKLDSLRIKIDYDKMIDLIVDRKATQFLKPLESKEKNKSLFSFYKGETNEKEVR